MEEFIQNYDKSITVVLFLLVIGLIVGGAYFYAWYKKRMERMKSEYDRYYEKIEKVLTYEICEQNYEWLSERLFIRLLECKYKDSERTDVLRRKFVGRYAEIIEKKRVSEID